MDTEKPTFTYVDSVDYRTDPATVADLQIGELVQVSTEFYGRPVTYLSSVREVTLEEFGVHVGTDFYEYDEYEGDLVYCRMAVDTITSVITRVPRPKPGDTVTYRGSLRDEHGQFVVHGDCGDCGGLPEEPVGRFVLIDPCRGSVLRHVGIGSVIVQDALAGRA